LQWFAEVINGVGKEEEREEETSQYLPSLTTIVQAPKF
jgi:hypothetical protein